MELHSVSCALPLTSSILGLSSRRVVSQIVFARKVGLRSQRVGPQISSQSYFLKKKFNESSLPNLKKGAIVCASNSNSEAKLEVSGSQNSGVRGSRFDGVEPFRGKSGSVSFHGLTHQLVEEGKLMSAPFDEEKGSFLWMLAPAALISSLILPQVFLTSAIEDFLRNETFVEIVSSLIFEVLFYIGLTIFLCVTDHVQRPYLEYSTKRWGLITGLKGYMSSAFFTVGFKVIAPLFAVYVTWPMIGLPALVAVVPFLVGCAAQFAFENRLEKHGSSCWPVVPIIFEVYRLFQLTRAAHFLEGLMFQMKGLPTTPELLEKSGALFSMIVAFQILAVVCLWSLMTFLLRLFPSRPVSEQY